MEEGLTKVGTVSHFFSNIMVAGVDVEKPFKVGDRLRFKGHTTDFEQEAGSIQIDNQNVEEVKAGDEIGIKVVERVRKGDGVYLVT